MSTISASTTSTTAFKVTSDTTGTLVLQTGSSPTTAVTIATTQYVNVGTGTSSYPLQIATNPSGSSQPMLAINPATGTNGSILYFNNSGSGGLLLGRSDSAGAGSGTTITAYDSFLATTGTTGLSFHTNNTRAMYISSGQLVGIGTASPAARLHVYGSGELQRWQRSASNVNNYALFKTETGADQGYLGFSDGDVDAMVVWNVRNSYLRFGTNNTERARFDSSGILIYAGNNFGATSYNSDAGTSYTVSLPDGYGSFELSISAYANNAGSYGTRNIVAHCSAYSGYPRTAFAPGVNTVTNLTTNMSGQVPGITLTAAVNGSINVTITGTGNVGSGYSLRRLNNSPVF